MDTEALRRSFKPPVVRILFVGESAPVSGDFFYRKSNMTTHTKFAFERVFGGRYESTEAFLQDFKSRGCYLDDLSLLPVNGMARAERARALREAIPGLAERIRAIEPAIVVVALKKIHEHVHEALRIAGVSAPLYVLPFAGQSHQGIFVEGLTRILEEQSPRRDRASLPQPPDSLKREKRVVATDNSLRSSYREMLLEHLFAGEIMRQAWRSGMGCVEVLNSQVDDGGYDLVIDGNGLVRHVQLKSTFTGSKVAKWNVNTALASKPGGCVVVLLFDQESLTLGPFLWFGGAPGRPLPDLSKFPVAKHTKGNAQGVKAERPRIRALSRSAFERVETIEELMDRLFGARS